ncbi:hypothetical protein BCR43DRAFT_492180 [Syncephalastrum racemosum]|uniref:Calponin homology domain-containing protein n=1 Tax=Syncephalastrum racemosum TaxID=13706 RepID=A0A1X2HEJ3_SYNRA|nr:hypothetical protein BCR43DRAFT_492180 [Syncephalastrum racemosum]
MSHLGSFQQERTPSPTDSDLCMHEAANTNVATVSPPDVHRRRGDQIVRAMSPEGRRYLKPVNGIQTKGFARSAQRRSSVTTLGPIERLQHFYAKRELKVNKGGILGFKRDQDTIVEDEDEEDEEMQEPEEPRPSWLDLNVETDLDVLLDLCRHDIQTTLALWNHPDRPAEAMLVPVTTMIESVRNYAFHRHDLPDTALKAMRSATLTLLSTMKDFELRASLDDLATERRALADYVEKIETHCFSSHPQPEPSPSKTLWTDENDLGSYYPLFSAIDHTTPDPRQDEDAFLQHLADGKTLCRLYNDLVNRSRRPFGFITQIHQDTRRTFRAVENLRFFAGACKLRFDLVLDPFEPAEIARKTDRGLSMLKQAITLFCDTVAREQRNPIEKKRPREALSP